MTMARQLDSFLTLVVVCYLISIGMAGMMSQHAYVFSRHLVGEEAMAFGFFSLLMAAVMTYVEYRKYFKKAKPDSFSPDSFD